MGTHACERQHFVRYFEFTPPEKVGAGSCDRVDAAIAEFKRAARRAKRAYLLQREVDWLDKKRWPVDRAEFFEDVLTDAYAHEREATEALLSTVPSNIDGLRAWFQFIYLHADVLDLGNPGWVMASQMQTFIRAVESFVCAQEEAHHG